MATIYTLDNINSVLPNIDVIKAMREAFSKYSRGEAIIPPVGELLFDNPCGEAHIKYGYFKGDSCFVIKVATGFYDNVLLGLPGNSGLMLVFDAKTGQLSSVLMDEGHLTNVRTAGAGALAASLLAPKNVNAIGIIGSGVQARMQAQFLKNIIKCRRVMIFARDSGKAEMCCNDLENYGFNAEVANSVTDLAQQCNLIVTTTAAKHPVITAADIRPGTHITAMGSDTPEKNEIDPRIFEIASIIAVDSRSQCAERGELHHALKNGALTSANIFELGELCEIHNPIRTNDNEITICDLTGVAVQDIAISKAVLEEIKKTHSEDRIQ